MRGSSIAVQPAPKRPRSAAARVRLPPRLLAYLQRWQRRRCVPFCRRMERRAGAAHQQSIPACPGGRRLGGRCGTVHIEAHGDHLAGAAWGAGSRDLWIFWHTPDMSVCTVTITRTARPTLSTRYVVPDRNPTDIPQPNGRECGRTQRKRLNFSAAPPVRDVGVAGSNPATSTRYSLVALNFHKYLQLLRRPRSYLREAVDCYNADHIGQQLSRRG